VVDVGVAGSQYAKSKILSISSEHIFGWIREYGYSHILIIRVEL